MSNRHLVISLVLLAGGAIAAGTNAEAQESEDQEEEARGPMEEVITTGTRVLGRTAVETPSPVDIVNSSDFRTIGVVETGKLLQLLAPSFNFSTTFISDGTDSLRPATLRGLGPDQTLILINGKRRHQTAHINVQQTIARGTAGTDINAIPSRAIERIEILRDGASAQYGSDAIAGVINIILKDSPDESLLEGEWGQTYVGDGNRIFLAGNSGFGVGSDGFVNVTLQYRDADETNRAAPVDPAFIPSWFPPGATEPEVKLRIGDGGIEELWLWANSAFPVGNGEIYAFGGWSERKNDSSGFWRGPGDNRTIPALYPVGFLPNIRTTLTDWSVAAGFRAQLGQDWDWDISLVTGESDFDFSERNTANVSWWFEPLDGMDAANGIFASSPTAADTGDLIHGETTANLDFRGVIGYGSKGRALNLATGLEWREDTYKIKAGDPVSYTFGRTNNLMIPIFGQDGITTAPPATQGFPGWGPTEAVDDDRRSIAVYGDVEADVTDRLLLGGALRFEDYSDFGNTLNGKLSGMFHFTERYALRGTISSGFRAPGVQQIFFSQRSTNLNAAGVLTDTLTARPDSALAQAFGFQPLKEETSTSYSIGFVGQPLDSLTLTLDLYRIDIDDRVVFSSSLEPEDATTCNTPPGPECPIRAILDPLGVGQAQFFTNAIDTKTTGLDFVSDWGYFFGDGSQFQLQGILHFNDTSVERINSQSSILTPDQVFDNIQVTLVERGQPRERALVQGTYFRNQWNATLRFNYFGEVSGAGFTGVETTWGAKTLVDLVFAYTFRDSLTLTVGGTNIFDTTPDQWANGTPFPELGFTYCWETCPFGINGGTYFARLDWRFARER